MTVSKVYLCSSVLLHPTFSSSPVHSSNTMYFKSTFKCDSRRRRKPKKMDMRVCRSSCEVRKHVKGSSAAAGCASCCFCSGPAALTTSTGQPLRPGQGRSGHTDKQEEHTDATPSRQHCGRTGWVTHTLCVHTRTHTHTQVDTLQSPRRRR